MTTAALRDSRSQDGSATRKMQTGLIRFGAALADAADADRRIVAGSADLKSSTLIAAFADRHPERFFQFGISERNMVSAAAGMATTGLIPYVSTFAAFAGLLCFENIRTDLAYPSVPVRVIATHAGIAMGFFATSHHATEDIAALRAVANLMILSPPDGKAAAALLKATIDHPQPIYFRLGRGRDEDVYDTVPEGYGPGAPVAVRSGADLLIVATGLMVSRSIAAADGLAKAGITCTVLDTHTLKPFPEAEIIAQAARHRAVLIVEEHNTEGGLGTMVQEALGRHRLAVPSFKHGLQDEFALIGPPHQCYRYYGLDGDGIAAVARRLLDKGKGHDAIRDLWTEDDRRRVLAEVGRA
ncbi:MAG: transketolase family protein [Parvibaculaceae bacterium]